MTTTLQDKFRALASQLKTELIERDPVIEGMICAALAGEHVLLLGSPGTAKSALANAFCGAVDGAQLFSWLLTRFTAPEELFGPISLEALKRDEYKRVTTGKLPQAHIVFLDEIFKANSAILNTLLTGINERKFHNNGGASDIPLRFVVGASNELPEGPELAALYDRFLCRYWVNHIESPDAFVRMLGKGDPAVKVVLTLKEWDDARTEVAAVTLPEDMARALFKLRNQLKNESVLASDRRWKRCVKLLKANAWMSGDAAISEDHFSVLSDALWDQPEQAGPVATKVMAIASSVAIESAKVRDTLTEMVKGMPDVSGNASEEDQKKLVAATREINRGLRKLRDLQDKARTTAQKKKVGEDLAAVESLAGPLKQAARETLGL